jgi:anthranilate phosphoribosyltransferase
MLKQKTISQLLSGELKEADVKKTLLELTPEKLDPASFKRCIEEVRQFCSPDFAKLSGLGANAIDCSGTGGSGRPRFNTSTASAFILSAASIKVAKFGNRAATSTSGSFDLLGQLNIAEKITPTALCSSSRRQPILRLQPSHRFVQLWAPPPFSISSDRCSIQSAPRTE